MRDENTRLLKGLKGVHRILSRGGDTFFPILGGGLKTLANHSFHGSREGLSPSSVYALTAAFEMKSTVHTKINIDPDCSIKVASNVKTGF